MRIPDPTKEEVLSLLSVIETLADSTEMLAVLAVGSRLTVWEPLLAGPQCTYTLECVY